ncbi:MAG: hypothetical protein D3M94_07325 [Rhodocyclales bacterium GT-UBC]|nr:MAG: hypothetical protein D3M94_07325 [Rhodocyclales bacterium GT-UBC]
MRDAEFEELAGRIDGIGRVVAMLIADLEMREQLGGDRFCSQLRSYADQRGRYAEHQKSAQVIWQIADELDAARLNRSAGH